MKYADLKADNERLRTQLADLVNAIAALRGEMVANIGSDDVRGPDYWASKLTAILDQSKAI